MKIKIKSLLMFSVALMLLSSAACAQKGKEKSNSNTELKTALDSVSYFFGTNFAGNFHQLGMDEVNYDAILQGLKDGMAGDESKFKISPMEGNNLARNYIDNIRARQGEAAMAKGQEYLDKKKAEAGIHATDSGILYEIEVEGDGEKPVETDKVRVHYEGKTIDGEIFDSSYERGQPAEFPLNRVIAGWTEILQQMPVGSTWIVTIPPHLAYGDRGSPPKIGPNEVLIFKIELIDIL